MAKLSKVGSLGMMFTDDMLDDAFLWAVIRDEKKLNAMVD